MYDKYHNADWMLLKLLKHTMTPDLTWFSFIESDNLVYKTKYNTANRIHIEGAHGSRDAFREHTFTETGQLTGPKNTFYFSLHDVILEFITVIWFKQQ